VISLEALADDCRLPVAELRARLDHCGIGHAGHGDAWEAQVRAMVNEIMKETAGVRGGQVVGAFTYDRHDLVIEAERGLRELIRRAFAAIELHDGSSQQAIADIKNTPAKVWHERSALYGPATEYLGHGWKLCVAVPDDTHVAVKSVIENLPSLFGGFQVWSELWSNAPAREAF
jgi:hypothetical protein